MGIKGNRAGGIFFFSFFLSKIYTRHDEDFFEEQGKVLREEEAVLVKSMEEWIKGEIKDVFVRSKLMGLLAVVAAVRLEATTIVFFFLLLFSSVRPTFLFFSVGGWCVFQRRAAKGRYRHSDSRHGLIDLNADLMLIEQLVALAGRSRAHILNVIGTRGDRHRRHWMVVIARHGRPPWPCMSRRHCNIKRVLYYAIFIHLPKRIENTMTRKEEKKNNFGHYRDVYQRLVLIASKRKPPLFFYPLWAVAPCGVLSSLFVLLRGSIYFPLFDVVVVFFYPPHGKRSISAEERGEERGVDRCLCLEWVLHLM